MSRNDGQKLSVAVPNFVSTLSSLSKNMGYASELESENLAERSNAVDAKNGFVQSVNDLAVRTFVPNVISSKGSFGKRMFRLQDHSKCVDPILIIGKFFTLWAFV